MMSTLTKRSREARRGCIKTRRISLLLIDIADFGVIRVDVQRAGDLRMRSLLSKRASDEKRVSLKHK